MVILSYKVVCARSTYGEVLDTICGLEEFMSEIKRQPSKCLWLINQALEVESADAEVTKAIAEIKKTFIGLGGSTKVRLNNHLVKVIDALLVKVRKDKSYLLELAHGGVQRDQVMTWTNMRLGKSLKFFKL